MIDDEFPAINNKHYGHRDVGVVVMLLLLLALFACFFILIAQRIALIQMFSFTIWHTSSPSTSTRCTK